MKIFVKKIAMILIILMLANSLSGCITAAVYSGGSLDGWGAFAFIITVPLDIVTSPIQLVIFAVEVNKSKRIKEKAKELDGVDSFSVKLSFIPQTRLDLLSEKLDSVPETEKNIFSNKVNSFSKNKFSALIDAFNKLTEAEIISSLDSLDSMPDEVFITALRGIK